MGRYIRQIENWVFKMMVERTGRKAGGRVVGWIDGLKDGQTGRQEELQTNGFTEKERYITESSVYW